jgi:metal-sulfur cluster biosynthetic enzyme
MTEAEVRAALDGVVDPCSVAAGAPAGLDALGLVRDVQVRDGEGGADVRVTLAVTDPGCLMGGPFAASARERLAALPGVARVEVALATRLDWSPADMAPAYAARLRAARRARSAAPPG